MAARDSSFYVVTVYDDPGVKTVDLRYPFDFAIHTLLVSPQVHGVPHTVEFGPVLQTDVGRTQLN